MFCIVQVCCISQGEYLQDEYCLSKKYWPILYSKLLYKLGQDFLVIQFNTITYQNDDAVEINSESRQVRLSQLFKWYAEDFGENMEAILRFVATKLTGQRREDLTQEITTRPVLVGAEGLAGLLG